MLKHQVFKDQLFNVCQVADIELNPWQSDSIQDALHRMESLEWNEFAFILFENKAECVARGLHPTETDRATSLTKMWGSPVLCFGVYCGLGPTKDMVRSHVMSFGQLSHWLASTEHANIKEGYLQHPTGLSYGRLAIAESKFAVQGRLLTEVTEGQWAVAKNWLSWEASRLSKSFSGLSAVSIS